MEKNGKFKNFKAFPAVPALLLVLPLFSYPLLWKKLFSVHQPLWGEVLAVSPSVMGFAAFGAICLAPQARFRRLWETPRLRIFLLFAVAGIFAAALQQAGYHARMSLEGHLKGEDKRAEWTEALAVLKKNFN